MQEKSLGKSKEVKYWEKYWEGDMLHGKRFLYDIIASFYRRFLIRPLFNYFIKKYFRKHSKVLHAGCGGGEVDMYVRSYIKITAMDFSQNALEKYQSRNKKYCKIVLGDIRSIPFGPARFEGIYNLGVMEHFTKSDIEKILGEFRRVLKPEGRVIIFWAPEFGLSVAFFKLIVSILKKIFRTRRVVLHPPEVSRIRSEGEARRIFNAAGFEIIEYYFGARDLFTYAVVVAQR